MLEELAVEVAGEGAFEAGRGGGEGALEELAVEVAGEGALEARRRGRENHPSTDWTGGADGEPSVDAWRVKGVHTRKDGHLVARRRWGS